MVANAVQISKQRLGVEMTNSRLSAPEFASDPVPRFEIGGTSVGDAVACAIVELKKDGGSVPDADSGESLGDGVRAGTEVSVTGDEVGIVVTGDIVEAATDVAIDGAIVGSSV